MKTILIVYTFLKNRTKLVRKRFAHRFKIFLKYHLKRKSKEPLFIITARRTGSNLLVDYLNSIPNVSFAGEILNRNMAYGLRHRFISKQAALRHIAYSINNCENKICGAKLVKVHMETYDIHLLDLKKLFPNARFIILYRKSLLEQFVSLKIAEVTDTWQWTKSFQLPPSVHVSILGLNQFYMRIKNFYSEIFKNSFLSSCAITISYEELTVDPQELFNETIFPFLGLLPSVIMTTHRKQNTKKLSEIIENYDEIATLIEESLFWKEYRLARKEWPIGQESVGASLANVKVQKAGLLEKILNGFKREVRTYWLILKDKRTPIFSKVLLGAALGYFFSPIDLILDSIPVIGYLDDVAIVTPLVWLAIRFMPKGLVQECRLQANQYF